MKKKSFLPEDYAAIPLKKADIEPTEDEVQSQIESWQSQLDWYSNQVSCCTVYITLNEVETLTPTSTSFERRELFLSETAGYRKWDKRKAS